MADATLAVGLGALLGGGGVLVLRLAWARARRHLGIVAGGWALLAASVVLAWTGAGAWGVAIAALVAMTVACLLLAEAAWRTPGGRPASPARRMANAAERAAPRHVGRRFATFLIVIPGGAAAALALAFAVRGTALLMGAGEADANVAALFAVPLAWGLIATILLMSTTRRTQALALLGSGIAGLPFMLGIGG